MFYLYFRRLANWFVANTLPPAACLFTPTCSDYCGKAVAKYGIFKGTLKCLWRILRCNPLSKGGLDPA